MRLSQSNTHWFWFIVLVFTCGHRLLPVQSSHDSFWYIPTAISICSEGNTDLDEYADFLDKRSRHATVEAQGKTFNLFPLMPALVATPVVCTYRWMVEMQLKARGDSLVNYAPDASPLFRKVNVLERGLASFLIGLASGFFFLLARLHFNQKSAFLLSGIVSFATAMLSIGSRALWPHTVVLPCMAISLYFVVKHKQSYTPWLSLLALPVAFSYLARPTNAVFVIGFGLWFLAYFKWRRTLPFVLLGSVVAMLFFTYNYNLYGDIFAPYFKPSRVGQAGNFWNAFLANTISPSRGLFLFNPLFGLILIDACRRLFEQGVEATDVLCVGVILTSMIVIASFPHWWGGHSYGPRFLTDLVPLFFLLGLRSMRVESWARHPRWTQALVIVSLLWGVYIHLNGAMNPGANAWNNSPDDVDQHPARIWDYSDPQFLRF